MITVRRERWVDCIDEIMPLAEAAHQLVEKNLLNLTLDLDFDLYEESEKTGQFHCLVFRVNGRAVGFHWITFNPMPRFKGLYQCSTDAIYISPQNRDQSKFFLKSSEEYIKKLGAKVWALATLDPEYRGDMWERNGFGKSETVFIKRVD